MRVLNELEVEAVSGGEAVPNAAVGAVFTMAAMALAPASLAVAVVGLGALGVYALILE